MRSIRTRALALLGITGLTAGLLGIVSGAPAGAVPQTGVLDCDQPSIQGPGSAPFAVTLDGTATASAFPTGATVSVTGESMIVTLDGQVVGGIKAGLIANGFDATAIGLADAIAVVGVANGTPSSITVGGITAAQVPVTNYSPTGGPGGTPIADTINLVTTGFSIPDVTTSGTDGGTLTFTQTPAGSGFLLSIAGFPLGNLGFGVLNNGIGGPGGTGNCTFFVGLPAPGAFASTSLVNAAPVVNALSHQAVAGISNNLIVTGTDADNGIDGSTWATGPVTCGTGTGSASVVTGTSSQATIAFVAPSNPTSCTFGVTVADTAGKVSASATQTVNVIAGDSLDQNVIQDVTPGVLDLLACDLDGNPGPDTDPDPALCSVTMSSVQLDGDPHTTTGAINQLTVIDARGAPVQWTLSATLQGALVNQNGTLTGPNAQIPAANMTLTTTSCAPDGNNANPAPAVGSAGTLDGVVTMCTAPAGSNTGKFTSDAGLELVVPSTVYSGTYQGTLHFVVQ